MGLKVAKENGFDIISTQGTSGCNVPAGQYMYGPCEDQGNLFCMPQDDKYITSGGFAKVEGAEVYSAPNGCANANYNLGVGITPAETLGNETSCGCSTDGICTVLANAASNAEKSNGIHWAVLMMLHNTSSQVTRLI